MRSGPNSSISPCFLGFADKMHEEVTRWAMRMHRECIYPFICLFLLCSIHIYIYFFLLMSFFPNTYYLLYWHEDFSPCQKIDALHMHWVQHILGLDLEILAWVFGHETLIKQNCKLGIHDWRLTSNLKITQLNRKIIWSKPPFSEFHVNFPGDKWYSILRSKLGIIGIHIMIRYQILWELLGQKII